MPKEKNFDESSTERKRLFRSKNAGGKIGNDSENSIFKEILARKQEKKIVTREIKTKRVKDILKSFSQFDEDILRLQGIENINSDHNDDSINKLSIEEMQNELQEYVLERDKIKTNLDHLVQQINETSNQLEQEEEKIQALSQKIQLQLKEQLSDLEDA